MQTKEKIKSKVDQLDPTELRIIDLMIDSLLRNRKGRRHKTNSKKRYYEDVISLIGDTGLSAKDIIIEREERL